jgi:hypothetical protein
VTTKKGIATEMSYSDALSLVTCLLGFIMWYQGTCFYVDYDTKEKEHQNTRQSDLYSGATPSRTHQISSCFDALSITKSYYRRKIQVGYSFIFVNVSS